MTHDEEDDSDDAEYYEEHRQEEGSPGGKARKAFDVVSFDESEESISPPGPASPSSFNLQDKERSEIRGRCKVVFGIRDDGSCQKNLSRHRLLYNASKSTSIPRLRTFSKRKESTMALRWRL